MPLLAGCASSGSPLDTRFPVAEHRFADQATEAFEQTETLRLGSGPHTLRIAASGNDGFAVYLRAPAEREPYSGVMLAGPLSGISVFGTFRINDLEFATQGKAGSWTLTFGCEGPCTYTIAIDEGLDIPEWFSFPEVVAELRSKGVRAEADTRNEKINYKVREHSVGKVPVIAVVGRKEAEEGTLALRFLGEGGKTQEILPLADAIARLSEDAKAPDLKRA